MMRPLTIKIGDLEVGLRPVPYLVAYGYAECWNEDPVARPMLALTFLGEALDHPDVPERELAEVRLTYAQRVADWLLSHGVSVQVAVRFAYRAISESFKAIPTPPTRRQVEAAEGFSPATSGGPGPAASPSPTAGAETPSGS